MFHGKLWSGYLATLGYAGSIWATVGSFSDAPVWLMDMVLILAFLMVVILLDIVGLKK
jgi:hypothetical protein